MFCSVLVVKIESISVSIKNALVPISCSVCNRSTLKWKCEECDIFMCNSCNERIKSTENHIAVSFENIEEDPSSSTDISSKVITSIFNSYMNTVPVSNI